MAENLGLRGRRYRRRGLRGVPLAPLVLLRVLQARALVMSTGLLVVAGGCRGRRGRREEGGMEALPIRLRRRSVSTSTVRPEGRALIMRDMEEAGGFTVVGRRRCRCLQPRRSGGGLGLSGYENEEVSLEEAAGVRGGVGGAREDMFCHPAFLYMYIYYMYIVRLCWRIWFACLCVVHPRAFVRASAPFFCWARPCCINLHGVSDWE